MLAAAVTELLELETARRRLFVLRRRVVPLLALSTLQRHNFPHFQSFSGFNMVPLIPIPNSNFSLAASFDAPEGRSARRG
jgi:hypothetical protein